jgi:6-phosphogluconolactonase
MAGSVTRRPVLFSRPIRAYIASIVAYFAGGENNVAVFSIDRRTGEPTLIQNADTRGFVPRTITFDKAGKILIAANQSARNVRNPDRSLTLVPTSLAVFRIEPDGTLEYVRKHDGAGGTWAGTLTAL